MKSAEDSIEQDNRQTPSVFVVAETRLYRDGLASLLASQPDVQVIGTAGNIKNGLALIGAQNPDVVLLDIEISDSLDAIRQIRRPGTKTKVITLATNDNAAQIVRCAEAGASGFITHNGSLDELIDAINCACAGELHCTPRVAAALAKRLAGLAKNPSPVTDVRCLTAREMEVIRLIEKGLSNKEIAKQMQIGVSTVKNHVHNILEKLNVSRRAQAAALVRQQVLRQ